VSEGAGIWYELSTTADHEAIESVAELLARYGYNEGVSIEEPFTQEQDGDNLTIDSTRPATVRTYIPAESYNEDTVQQIRDGLWHLGRLRAVGELTVTQRSEEDWATAWKEHYRPLRASNRFVIRPPWFEAEPTGDDIVLVLDPGMVFGTGMHPTTRLSLYQIERHVSEGQSVFDVGTGSGILAIAASRLGATPIDAVDIDPMSVRVARSNLELNDLAGEITLEVGSADWATHAQKTYDVVIANIIARILIEFSADLRHCTRPGGLLLLSGIIEPKESLVREAFEPAGFRFVDRNQIEDWVSLTYRAPE
jgi:ribosomal protein L11 methyltransferase